ncbi:MAG: histone deacetylase family protein, partial [Candidatus Odinarchaeia archaeon]
MPKTGVVLSEKYMRHYPGRGHPERPERISSIINVFKSIGFYNHENISIYEPLIGLVTDVELVHPKSYIQKVKSVSESGGGPFDMDTVASPETYKTALLAVGGVLKAADHVLDGDVKNAIAFIRPPGHHAGFQAARGFCFFNNIAILCEYLRQRKGLKKIMIIDVDVHHGNGTQEIFNDKSYVVYVGLHQDPRTHYPGTGYINQIGV